MNKLRKYTFLAVTAANLLVLGIFIYNDSQPLPKPEPVEQAEAVSGTTELVSVAVTAEPLTVRELVLQLTGQTGDGTPESRRAALEQLPGDLNTKELAAIFSSILEQPRPEDFPLRAWHALYNDVLNALVLDQEAPVTKLPNCLMATIKDAQRHRVVRDYALQHLLAFAEYRAESSERVELLEAAWQAIYETRDSYRGTYLVALSYKAGEPGWLDAQSVSTKAWEVAASGDAHVLSRISALQVCGKLGYQKALPLALEIAGDAKAHMTLRTSAIATIGDLGLPKDQVFLNELAQRSPPRLLVAIQAALGRIEAKGNQA